MREQLYGFAQPNPTKGSFREVVAIRPKTRHIYMRETGVKYGVGYGVVNYQECRDRSSSSNESCKSDTAHLMDTKIKHLPEVSLYIGGGSTGRAYHDNQTGRCWKLTDRWNRWARESRMLRYLNSKGNTEKHIVQYIETCMCEHNSGYWYCVVTNYAGNNLKAMLDDQEYIDLSKLIQNLTTAVDYLHKDLLVYHRDIKCQNVFYDGNTFRLGNFDLSLFVHEDTDDTRDRGTSNDMLPIDTVITCQHFGFVADRFATWVTFVYAGRYNKNEMMSRETGNHDIDKYWTSSVLPYIHTKNDGEIVREVKESNICMLKVLKEETCNWNALISRGVNTFRATYKEAESGIALRYPIEQAPPVTYTGKWGMYVYENYIYMSAQRRYIHGDQLTEMTTRYGIKHTSDTLRHKNEVEIYNLLWTCPLPFLLQAVSFDHNSITLEHCDLDLVDYINNKKTSLRAIPTTFNRLAQHLSSAVECLHTMHILHMDIKMENIFVIDAQSEYPIFKLGDFDLSVLATKWNKNDKYCGSAISRLPKHVELIVPPESFLTGIAMDWFSVSVVLADAWIGRHHLILHKAVNKYMICKKEGTHEMVEESRKELNEFIKRDGDFVNNIVDYCLNLRPIDNYIQCFLHNHEVQRIFRERFIPYTKKAFDQSMQDAETIVNLLVELTDIPLEPSLAKTKCQKD